MDEHQAPQKMLAQMDSLLNAREAADVETARRTYLAAVARLSLGVEIRSDGIYTRAPAAEGQPLTAFPPDLLEVADSPAGARQSGERGAKIYGPAVRGRTAAELGAIMQDRRVPVFGFEPVSAVAGDPEGRARPADLAAHLAGPVVEENPYDLIRRDADATDTLAHITTNYLQRVVHEATVRIAAGPGLPTVLVALRPLEPGTRLSHARTPRHLLADDGAARRVAARLKEIGLEDADAAMGF